MYHSFALSPPVHVWTQWRIQDFGWGGAETQKRGVFNAVRRLAHRHFSILIDIIMENLAHYRKKPHFTYCWPPPLNPPLGLRCITF